MNIGSSKAIVPASAYLAATPVSKRPALSTHADSVQFGFTAENPPEYQIELSLSDLVDPTNTSNPQPTPEFVARLNQKLVGDDDDTPRFVQVVKTIETLGSRENALQFHKNLIPLLTDSLSVEHGEFQPRGEKVLSTHADKYNDFEIPAFHRQKNTKTKMAVRSDLHRDGDVIALISISYGPFKNIEGGHPKVADFRHLLRDENKNKLADQLFNKRFRVESFWNDKIKPFEEKLKEYTVVLDQADYEDDLPLVIINNTRKSGVLHGATWGKRTSTDPDNKELYPVRMLHRIKLWLQSEDEPKYGIGKWE